MNTFLTMVLGIAGIGGPGPAIEPPSLEVKKNPIVADDLVATRGEQHVKISSFLFIVHGARPMAPLLVEVGLTGATTGTHSLTLQTGAQTLGNIVREPKALNVFVIRNLVIKPD